MKILNLYSGIGGNRKLWGNEHEITAVEIDENIAKIYKDFFPEDDVVIDDAHEYLLKNFDKYDFIWSSPPCPTHSDIRRCGVQAGMHEIKYPEMSLYEEIILLKHFHKKNQKYVIENVKPYYDPLIKAQEFQRHLFGCNFTINEFNKKDDRRHDEITGNKEVYGFKLKNYTGIDKRKCLRNMVNPQLALHILNCAIDQDYREETEQIYMF